MFLFYTFLFASVLINARGLKCDEETYSAYLALHPSKNPTSSPSYYEEHKNIFIANCRKVLYRKSVNKASDITVLTDWSDSQLDVLGDLIVKYNHIITLNDPVDVKNVTFNIRKPNREFPELDEANDPKKGCATSWVSAAIEVAEAALDYSVKLSSRQLFECLPIDRGLDDGCDGVYPKVLMDYLLEVGLVEDDKFTGCDSLGEVERYTFYPTSAEPPNASGLMNLIAEGKPVFAMIAVDLKKLRYVKDMSKSNEYLKCGDYQPALYGIVNGYNYDKDNMKKSWWEFTSRIVPEEEVIMKMPMTDNMENANYAGIAAYAFTLTKAEHVTPVPSDSVTPVPSDSVTPVPSDRVTPVPTDRVTPVPSDRVTPVPSDRVTPVPSDRVTPVPTDRVTPVPTDRVTPVPTDRVTPVPTDRVTPAPTDRVTPVPTDRVTPAPTDDTSPTPTDEFTPSPTPTAIPEPWFPIYDPFIYGDNTNYANRDICIDEIPSDYEILKYYLAIRDEYPHHALKNTRVLALAGMSEEAIDTLKDSLKKQEKSDSPIDLYFFSDYVGARYTNSMVAEVIPSLSCYTYPSRMVIAGGVFQMPDLGVVINGMIDSAETCDGFKNLKYLEISGHKLGVNYTVSRENEKTNALSKLQKLCERIDLFPVLETINLNQNYYMLYNDGFDEDLKNACKDITTRDITITAEMWDDDIQGKSICTGNPDGVGIGRNYYTIEESEQCKYTWNWEYRDLVSQSEGPYPKVDQNPECAIAVRRLEGGSGSSGQEPPTEIGGVIYDPFILGDNSVPKVVNEQQCSKNLSSYMDNLKQYLYIRDQYPTSALKNTRVLALMGMTSWAVELFIESLSKQDIGDNSIEMYFYSDYVHNYIYGIEMALPLISLSQYTYPKKIVFSDGDFGQRGVNDILGWMVENADKGYFKYLESLKITRHRLNHHGITGGGVVDQIIEKIETICGDNVNFPALMEMNFDNNAFHEYQSGNLLQKKLKKACHNSRSDRDIIISAFDYGYYPVNTDVIYICPPVDPQSGYSWNFYDSNSVEEDSQCKNTWHWDLFGTNRDIVNGGPYPLMNNEACRPID